MTAPTLSAERVLWKGNEAIAEAAIQAGCDAYFGYPITPQAELLEWMARRMPELGRVFVQAESELGAITMALGAAATGARVLVSSSSPGISLMAEAMSYMAGSEIPVVLVDVMRGGPGLGSIGPSQSDYFQIVKGHGHGDYRVPVLAPASISEAMALVADAFEIAERYRTPVVLLADGIMGQAMEPIVPSFRFPPRPESTWQADAARDRAPRVVKSLHLQPEALEAHNLDLQAKFERIAASEVRFRTEELDDAEVAIVAYGGTARAAAHAVTMARERGVKAGLFKPLTLWPFPEAPVRALAARVQRIVVAEMNLGQIRLEVERLAGGRAAVVGVHRADGLAIAPEQILAAIAREQEAAA